MIQQQVYLLTNIAMLLDGIMVITAGYISYFLNYLLKGQAWSMTTEVFVASVLAVMVLNNYFLGYVGLYDDRRPASTLALGAKISQSLVIVFSILSVAIFVLHSYDYPRLFFIFFGIFCLLLMFIERLIFRAYFFHVFHTTVNSRKILIVGSMERGEFVASLLEKQLSWGHEVIGRLAIGNNSSGPAIGTIDDLYDVIRSTPIDEVVFALEADQLVSLNPYVELCKRIGVSVRILPAVWEVGDINLSVDRCQGVPFIVLRAANFNATGLLYKRILDIIGGAIGTLLFLAIYPLVGLAIKLDSPGPVIFAQKRVGMHGRIFKLYKFRSMYQDAEARKKALLVNNEMEGAIFKISHDPRVTRVGRWLRSTSIDEIPQFLNVLAGDMSLVGTRPPTLDEVARYSDWHFRRLSIKPGMTGLWQVSGRNRVKEFDKIVELDCAYLDNWRFFRDLRIIFQTIAVVLRRKGW